jgi:hypothetical protein
VSTEGVSIHYLAGVAGCNDATVKKWLGVEGLKPVKRRGQKRWFDETEAMAVIRDKKRVMTPNGTHPNIDPKTGLTWQQKELKEKARKLEMENDRAAKLLSEEIMLTADHHRIIAAIAGRMEQFPGKFSSEQGLSPSVTLALRRGLDELREVAAKEIEEMELENVA